MAHIDWNAVGSGISAVIALLSLCVVLYMEFLQGPRLQTFIDRISLLRVPQSSRAEIMVEVLVDDLLSDPRSTQANGLLAAVPTLANAVSTRDRRQVAAALQAHARTNQVTYDPAPSAVAKYSQDPRFVTNFYVPLIVANGGRKTGYVTSLVLVARDKSAPTRKWAFVPFVLLDPKKLIAREEKDADRISGLFVGLSIPPKSSVDVHPWFIPLPDADNRIISRSNMSSGEYDVRVFGFGTDGKCVFRSRWSTFKITDAQVQSAFQGSDAIDNISIEKHVAEAITQDD